MKDRLKALEKIQEEARTRLSNLKGFLDHASNVKLVTTIDASHSILTYHVRYVSPLIEIKPVLRFVTDDSWQNIEKLEKESKEAYFAALKGWNGIFSKKIPSEVFSLEDIFEVKKHLYRLQVEAEALNKIILADKILLKKYNTNLSTELQTFFLDLDEKNLNPARVERIFDIKKSIACLLRSLEKPLDAFVTHFPDLQKIDNLKNYTTHPATGRYRNLSSHTNLFNMGVPRSIKLQTVIDTCEQIVLNVREGKLDTSAPALQGGKLKKALR